MKHCHLGVLYRWLILFGLILFGLFLLWQNGLLAILFTTDPSSLSLIILCLLGLTSLHAGWQAFRLSKEFCACQELLDLSEKGILNLKQVIKDNPNERIFQYLNLLQKRQQNQPQNASTELLLENLRVKIDASLENGWFLSDLMLKLGLLGTVIGFIFMLGTIAGTENLNAQAMKQLLSSMTGGMRIALYTTLTGLSAGILLAMQYRLLEQAADHILALIIELSEVHLIQPPQADQT